MQQTVVVSSVPGGDFKTIGLTQTSKSILSDAEKAVWKSKLDSDGYEDVCKAATEMELAGISLNDIVGSKRSPEYREKIKDALKKNEGNLTKN